MARAAQRDVTEAIEKLSAGQTVTYKIAETFGGEHAVVQFNPESGSTKYIMTLEKIEGGKPTGKKQLFMKHDSPRFIANWIYVRWGELVTS